ncbi:MAG: amidohydrolase family protein [Clostridia bacterium]|nr:amidohydrolase family protein [Clostridia bacterium]
MFDIVIRNGSVLDGSGREAQRLDVGVRDGKIAALGDLSSAEAGNRIDAGGRTVCPGFLDLHRHADAALFQEGYGDCDLYQGITTIGNGNCGLSLAPQAGPYEAAIGAYLHPVTGDFSGIPVDTMEAYLRALKARPLPVNALMLAGGSTIRASVAGFQKLRLEDEDYAEIHRRLERSLAAGAGGVSLGLGYAPECYYNTKELIRALEPIRNTDTVLSVHMREEAMKLLPSLEEMIVVAGELRVPLQISHLKASGRENWGKLAPRALDRIAKAREEGIDVCCDAYAYTAGSTQLIHILPPEFLQGGPAAITERLRDEGQRRKLLDRLETGRDFDNYVYLVGWENIFVSAVKRPEDGRYVGMSIAQAAGDKDPAEFALDLLRDNDCEVTMIDFITSEEDIARILQSPFAYAVSDATFPTGGKLHPRVYGAFSQVIETYVNGRHALTLPEAVNRMTRRPADRYRLKNKGRIELGADGDVLVFDPGRVHVTATYDRPAQRAAGMDYVIVNGKIALRDGRLTGVQAGNVLEGNK